MVGRYEGAARQTLKGKMDLITYSLWSTTAEQTNTFENAYESAANGFEEILKKLRKCDKELRLLQEKLDKAGAPGTPGSIPEWNKD